MSLCEKIVGILAFMAVIAAGLTTAHAANAPASDRTGGAQTTVSVVSGP